MGGPTTDLPQAYQKFIHMFNDGAYWESHEVLEDPWLINRSRFYRGMIIYASAFVHARRGNPRGVWKQMTKAERYLREFLPYYMGLDVARILDRAAECKTIVDAEALASIDQVPPEGDDLIAAIPFDHLALKQRFIRGDEEELSP